MVSGLLIVSMLLNPFANVSTPMYPKPPIDVGDEALSTVLNDDADEDTDDDTSKTVYSLWNREYYGVKEDFNKINIYTYTDDKLLVKRIPSGYYIDEHFSNNSIVYIMNDTLDRQIEIKSEKVGSCRIPDDEYLVESHSKYALYEVPHGYGTEYFMILTDFDTTDYYGKKYVVSIMSRDYESIEEFKEDIVDILYL